MPSPFGITYPCHSFDYIHSLYPNVQNTFVIVVIIEIDKDTSESHHIKIETDSCSVSEA